MPGYGSMPLLKISHTSTPEWEKDTVIRFSTRDHQPQLQTSVLREYDADLSVSGASQRIGTCKIGFPVQVWITVYLVLRVHLVRLAQSGQAKVGDFDLSDYGSCCGIL